MGRRGPGIPKVKKPPVTYSPAPEVGLVADGIIDRKHKHLRQPGVRLEYIFRSDTPRKHDKEIMGTARKVSSLAAFFGRRERDGEGRFARVEPFFAIVVSKPVWDGLSEDHRAALVDHELCHCWAEPSKTGEVVLKLLPHDLEEFVSVVNEHGLWTEDVRRFTEAAATGWTQPELPLSETPAMEPAPTREYVYTAEGELESAPSNGNGNGKKNGKGKKAAEPEPEPEPVAVAPEVPDSPEPRELTPEESQWEDPSGLRSEAIHSGVFGIVEGAARA